MLYLFSVLLVVSFKLQAAWETVDLAATANGSLAVASPSALTVSPATGELFYSFSKSSMQLAIVRCSFNGNVWKVCFEEQGQTVPRVSVEENGDVFISTRKMVSDKVEQLYLYRRLKDGTQFEKIATLDLGETLISTHRICTRDEKIYFYGALKMGETPFVRMLDVKEGKWADLLYSAFEGEPVVSQTVSCSSAKGLVGAVQTTAKTHLVFYGQNLSSPKILFTSLEDFSFGAVRGDIMVLRKSYMMDQVRRYKIIVSNDFGKTWKDQDYPFLQKNGSNRLFSTAISPDGQIAMAGFDETEVSQGVLQEVWTVRVSDDLGKTWQLSDFVPSDTGISSDAYDVKYTPGGEIYASGYAKINGVGQGRVRRLSN